MHKNKKMHANKYSLEISQKSEVQKQNNLKLYLHYFCSIFTEVDVQRHWLYTV